MDLEKWYLDAVFADGTVWFGYRARLRLCGCASIAWCSGCEVLPDGTERRVSAWRNSPAPRLEEGSWSWTGPDGFRGRWTPSVASKSLVLAADDQLQVRWNCVAPRALIERSRDGGRRNGDNVLLAGRGPERTTRGVGYLECLRLQSSRSTLPFRELRWGRAHVGESSLVWLRWGQGRDLSLVLEDGLPSSGNIETLADGGLCIRTEESCWETGAGRILCNRDVRRSFPGWLVWLTGGLAPAQELKIAGAIRQRNSVGVERAGSGIWEEVRWE